ncbi:MAG: response regulator transcription factor [Clostridia bacterium]|nr:response regulator transcription factor [Clostridia bacterium]
MELRYSVLVVEDEKNIASFIKTVFEANNFNVLTAHDGKEALMLAVSHCPDIIILDLGLPDMDGMNIIKSVREWSAVPIVVVSARGDENDKILALDAGADDYVTKPFGTGELLARVRTALRHARNAALGLVSNDGKFVSGELTVDFDKRHVYISGNDIHLTQNEYKIVSLLARYAGKVLTYDNIMKQIWGPNFQSDNQILRVNMANIRRKMEENPAEPKYIFTELGVGYRMLEDE